ncbi:pancreas transcription factor 1 subunit alpha-like [Orbicella faveolata]|uniref:pancreas transcription factor 1 subunit alpha-like n=1 Tax=Orbicella faveolata TaxID=48498 RepID=UPI0009E61E71|nr:pancreas transcription factor 1 subunit alpha-like [Orbicella faveolata]
MGNIGEEGKDTKPDKNVKRKSKRRPPRLTGVSKQRKMANERERRRVHALNSHIENLRDHIPLSPFEKRPTKTEVIWMAATYIKFLTDLLEKSDKTADNTLELGADDTSQSLDLTFIDIAVSDIFCLDECSAVAELDLDDILFLTDSEAQLSEN